MKQGAVSVRSVYGVLLATAAIIVALDQITKQIALDALDDGPIELIGGVLTLQLTFNSGGAFGVLQGVPELFMVATVLVAAIILRWAHGLTDIRWAVPLGMVLGGGLGNACDRIFRDLGGRVVDFVDLHVWPVFNLADSAITVGVILLLVMSARGVDSTRARSSPPEIP